MSNTDVLNDNVRLVRLVHKLEGQRDELLKALEAMVREFQHGADRPQVWALQGANAAIAKAKGTNVG